MSLDTNLACEDNVGYPRLSRSARPCFNLYAPSPTPFSGLDIIH